MLPTCAFADSIRTSTLKAIVLDQQCNLASVERPLVASVDGESLQVGQDVPSPRWRVGCPSQPLNRSNRLWRALQHYSIIVVS